LPVTRDQKILENQRRNQRRLELAQADQAHQRFLDSFMAWWNRLFPNEPIIKSPPPINQAERDSRFDDLIAWWNRLFPNESIIKSPPPINQPERKPVEDTKEEINEGIKSLEEINDKSHHECPITAKLFHEMDTPVVNLDGNIVERDSPMVGRNLLNPQQEIGFIKSAQLIKIQDDVKSIRTEYSKVLKKNDDIMDVLKNMLVKMDDMKADTAALLKKVDEQGETIAALRKDNAEQSKEIAALRKDNAELHKDNVGLLEKMDSMNDTLVEQRKEISGLNEKMEQKDKEWELKLAKQEKIHDKKMNEVLEQMDEKDKEICSLKTIVHDQDRELKKQSKEINNLNQIIDQQTYQNKELILKVNHLEELVVSLKADSDQFVPNNNHHPKQKLKEPKISRSEESLGRKWSAYSGFAHTNTFGDNPKTSPFYNEITENTFRRHAYEGNIVKLKERLDKDKNKLHSKDDRLKPLYHLDQFWHAKMDINGRGMPDAICSIVRGFKDKTALMLASQQGHLDCVQLLVKYEADLNFLDRDNFTALDYAQQKKHKEVVDFLKENGAVNGVDVLHYLKKEGIQKKDGIHYESENFDITSNNEVPAAIRVLR
jgi:hypothetical protein